MPLARTGASKILVERAAQAGIPLPPSLPSPVEGCLVTRENAVLPADAASKTVSEVPKIDLETIQATLLFSLEKALLGPDIVILHVKPIIGLRIALSLNYTAGGRISPSFAGIGGTCGDVTALPYLTNKPNFTIGDFGDRKRRAPEEINRWHTSYNVRGSS